MGGLTPCSMAAGDPQLLHVCTLALHTSGDTTMGGPGRMSMLA